MTEDRLPKASEESSPANGAGKQRKKRKWDQPADSLMSVAMAVTGTIPAGVNGVYASVLPSVLPLSVPLHLNPATIAATSQSLQIPLIPPNAAVIVQKLSQPKIQDELIAREIVINDADPSVRYKLTKRQTQEEIQKSTGAVVITRGKYRPPNGLPDGEKPLYLHISAGAHLKDTVERIKAVDHAALMVEDMLKQCQSSLPVSSVLPSVFSNGLPQATQPLNTCLYLGFEPDPSFNIAARIRGPNDQYINHIMNETGATVVLRGHGSENPDNSNNEKPQQPLHLFLSSSNPKSLEDARILAENLLDTICAECGISRISSSKTYNAVPPPQQLLAGLSSASLGSTSLPVVSMPMASPNPVGSSVSSACSSSIAQPTPSQVNYSHLSMSGGTSYSGYGGIYPQATPLQQVALALRQAPPNMSSPVMTSQAMVLPKTSISSAVEMDKRPSQKRKFQELPVPSVRPMMPKQNLHQESEFLKPGIEDSSAEGLFSVPPPKKLLPTGSSDMPPPLARTMAVPPLPPLPPLPPPSRSMPLLLTRTMPPPPPPSRSMPPPPPPKFSPAKDENGSSVIKRLNSEPIGSTDSKNTDDRNIEPVPDTLLKLMEYGDEDDTDGAGE